MSSGFLPWERNGTLYFGKYKSIIQTAAWSVKLYLIKTLNWYMECYTREPTLGSWMSGILKEVSHCLQLFLHTQAKLFTLTQNTKIKNAGMVFLCSSAWGLCQHSITFLRTFWKPEHLFWTFEVADWYFT